MTTENRKEELQAAIFKMILAAGLFAAGCFINYLETL